MVVTKATIIGDVLDFNPETAQFFFEIGMHCLGCAMAHGETVEQAVAGHQQNLDEILEKLNDF